VAYAGSVLIKSARIPALDACRALLARGLTGKLQVWRPGSQSHDLVLDIEQAAGWTVWENEQEGPRFVRWRSFAADNAACVPDALSYRAVSPPAATDEIPALEPA